MQIMTHCVERRYNQSPANLFVGLMSSWFQRFRIDWFKHPSEAFLDYLEGYASAYDIHQTCKRRRQESFNYDELAEQFWRMYLAEASRRVRIEGHGEKEQGQGDDASISESTGSRPAS